MPNEFADYRQKNKACELYWCPFLPPQFKNPKASEINHIFRRLSDHTSNIIHLSAEAHRWFHLYPADGRILCLLVKARKKELDSLQLKLASGIWVSGWLETANPRLDWIGMYRDELRQHLAEIENEQGSSL